MKYRGLFYRESGVLESATRMAVHFSITMRLWALSSSNRRDSSESRSLSASGRFVPIPNIRLFPTRDSGADQEMCVCG